MIYKKTAGIDILLFAKSIVGRQKCIAETVATKSQRGAKFCKNCGNPVASAKQTTDSAARKSAGNEKGKRHTLRNATIAIVVCAAVVIVLIVVLLPRVNTVKTPGEGDTNPWVLATETVYNDSQMDSYTEYFYNNDRLLSSEICYDEPNGSVKNMKDYTYDKNGNLTLEICTYPSGNEERTEYTYDKNNNMTSEVHKDSEGNETKRTEYTYDENGNLTLELETAPDGSWDRSELTYDENNYMTLLIELDSDGYGGYVECTYDENGNVTSADITDTEGEWYRDEFVYDENGNVTMEFNTYSDGEVDFTEYVYDYDENGNLTSEVMKLEEKEWRTEYTYELYETLSESH